MNLNLSTKYLGLQLTNPLVIAACPITGKVDWLKKLEEAGAAAAVMPSLFEEQIEHDEDEMTKLHEFGTESFAEALHLLPRRGRLPHRSRGISGNHRAGEEGRQDADHRQLERHHRPAAGCATPR